MLRNRFWSHLSEFEDDLLDKGITELEEKYKEFETLSFNDCLILLIGRKLPLFNLTRAYINNSKSLVENVPLGKNPFPFSIEEQSKDYQTLSS